MEHPFTPTLTLSHHESGWDGTFGSMLDAMAGVLDDGPVTAEVSFWDEVARTNRTRWGLWVSRSNESITLLPDGQADPITIEELDLLALSI